MVIFGQNLEGFGFQLGKNCLFGQFHIFSNLRKKLVVFCIEAYTGSTSYDAILNSYRDYAVKSTN